MLRFSAKADVYVAEKGQDAFELFEKNKIHHDTPPDKPHNAGLIPEANANFFSRLCYMWLNPIVRKGAKSPLQSTDLYDLDDRLNAKHVSALFRANWNIEKVSYDSCSFTLPSIRVLTHNNPIL